MELEIFGRVVQRLEVLFYDNDVIIPFPWKSQLQEALGVLAGIFGQVGLSTKLAKMLGMTYHPIIMTVHHFEAA